MPHQPLFDEVSSIQNGFDVHSAGLVLPQIDAKPVVENLPQSELLKMATNQRRWKAIDAFEHFGTFTKDQYAWSAQSTDRSVTAITLWEDEIRDDGDNVIADTSGHPTLEFLINNPRNKQRIKHLQDVWAGSREFRVIILRAVDVNSVPRKVEARWPDDHLIMTLTDLDAETGEFRAIGKRKTGAGWTTYELSACVSAYRELWDAQEAGQRLNKSELRRQVLRERLSARSEGAYERRMQNISAVIDELGMPFVAGYVPLRNIGNLKEEIIALINEEWRRETVPELPTDDPDAFSTRVSAALQKTRGSGFVPRGSNQVSRVSCENRRFVREPEVAAWVLIEADGICEACGHDAPFVRSDGTPYLEVHHVRWLAEGGPDTTDNAVAICPNCHRRMHSSDDRVAFRREVISLVARIKDFPKNAI